MNKPIIDKGEINFSHLFYFLRKNFKVISFYSFGAVIVFTIYFFFKTPTYSSKLTFYTNYNDVNQSALLSPFIGNLAGLDESGLNFSVSEYLESDKMLRDIVELEYLINNKKITLVEHWGKNYNQYFYINPLNTLKSINRNIRYAKMSNYDKKLAYAQEILSQNISFSENRKTGLSKVVVSVKKYPNLSSDITENIYLSLISFSIEINNIKAKEKIVFINERINQVKNDLTEAEEEMVIFLDENKNLNSSPRLLVEKERIQRKISLYSSLFISLSDQLELAKIDEKDNTSSIFVLDKPISNGIKNEPNFLNQILILFTMFFFSLSLIFMIQNRKSLINY